MFHFVTVIGNYSWFSWLRMYSGEKDRARIPPGSIHVRLFLLVILFIRRMSLKCSVVINIFFTTFDKTFNMKVVIVYCILILFACQSLKKLFSVWFQGDFVIEYVGEIINRKEYNKRAAEIREKRKANSYFLHLDSKRMIDAGPSGNVARFINHSCDPNCQMIKWSVNGDARIGIFAIRNILPGKAQISFFSVLMSSLLSFKFLYWDLTFFKCCCQMRLLFCDLVWMWFICFYCFPHHY